MMPQVKMLADGVRLCYVQTDRFKTSNITVSAALPLGEDAGTNALLIYLLKRSCKKYPDFTCLNGKLDELYGASLSAGVMKIGEAQVLRLSMSFIDDRFTLGGESISDECAGLLAGMLFEPNCKSGSFGSAAVESEKRLLKQRIEDEINDKRAFALQRCIELMCSEEAYGRGKYGTVEEIDAITMKKIYEAWKNLLKTAVFQIDVVSSAPCKKIEKVFADKFKKIEREPAVIETLFLTKAKRFHRHEESFPVNQGKLVMGFRSGMADEHDNRPAVTVMNDIFGGGTYSKLFANVREKLSLAYYCRSRLCPSKGLIFVESGIDLDKEKKVSAEILCQLSDVRNGKIKPEVLEASKLSIKSRWTHNTPEEICAWYSSQLLESELETPEKAIEGIQAVTVEEISEAAKKVVLDTIYMLSGTGEEKAEEAQNDED